MLAVLFAVLASIVYLRLSQLGGRLAEDLTYDDVVYANDAAERLLLGADGGLLAFFRSFVENPPHSPFATLLAIAAFAIGGLNDLALYASNTLVLAGVAAFLAYELRNSRNAVVFLVVAIVLLSPLAYHSIHDFRPDIPLGFATAAMVWWFWGGVFGANRRLFRRAGYLLGACLLIKPSFFAATIAIALFSAGAAGAMELLRRRGFLSKPAIDLHHLLQFLGAGMLIAAPYFALTWPETFRYFWDNTRGNQADIWSFSKDLGLFDLFETFLWDRDFTFRVLGFHLIFSAAALVVCMPALITRGAGAAAARISAVCVTAFVSLSIIVFGRHKNDFFLSSFQFMVLFAAVFAIAELDQQLNRAARVALMGAAIAGFSIVIWLNATLTHWHRSTDARIGSSWNQKIIAQIRQHQAHVGAADAKAKPAEVYVSFAGAVSSSSLRWLGIRDGFPVNASDEHRSSDPEVAKTFARRADYVVVPNPLTADYARSLPSGLIQTSFLTWLAGDSGFTLISSATSAAHYFVFAKLAPSAAFEPTLRVDGIPLLDGFRLEEGPYPQWAFPRVRWMHKPEGRLCVLAGPAAPRRIKFRFRSEGEGRLEVADQDGQKLAVAAARPGEFIDLEFTYPARKPNICLSLSAKMVAPADPDRLLLFSKLEVRSE
ncbi:MAG: hypothetical protein M3461_23385 [Pseudomonadota bacterium]|nr:hypothetical protein [Pseudomonadota bacterium]